MAASIPTDWNNFLRTMRSWDTIMSVKWLLWISSTRLSAKVVWRQGPRNNWLDKHMSSVPWNARFAPELMKTMLGGIQARRRMKTVFFQEQKWWIPRGILSYTATVSFLFLFPIQIWRRGAGRVCKEGRRDKRLWALFSCASGKWKGPQPWMDQWQWIWSLPNCTSWSKGKKNIATNIHCSKHE